MKYVCTGLVLFCCLFSNVVVCMDRKKGKRTELRGGDGYKPQVCSAREGKKSGINAERKVFAVDSRTKDSEGNLARCLRTRSQCGRSRVLAGLPLGPKQPLRQPRCYGDPLNRPDPGTVSLPTTFAQWRARWHFGGSGAPEWQSIWLVEQTVTRLFQLIIGAGLVGLWDHQRFCFSLGFRDTFCFIKSFVEYY